jgi:hypothetical protein
LVTIIKAFLEAGDGRHPCQQFAAKGHTLSAESGTASGHCDVHLRARRSSLEAAICFGDSVIQVGASQ